MKTNSYYQYFWTGEHRIHRWLNPRYMAPYYGMKWEPPAGVTMDPLKMLDSDVNIKYMDDMTAHGTVTYDAFGVTVKWDKDRDTVTISYNGDRSLWNKYAYWDACWKINNLAWAMPCNVLYGEGKHVHWGAYLFGQHEWTRRTVGWPRTKEIVLSIYKKHSAYPLDNILTVLNEPVEIHLRDFEANLPLKARYDALTATINADARKRHAKYLKAIYAHDTGRSLMEFTELGLHLVPGLMYTDFPLTLIPPGRAFDGVHDNKYVLTFEEEKRYLIQEEGYDGHGSRIWKVVSLRQAKPDNAIGGMEDVVSVCLIGKEYTGQWWMHYLPKFYATQSIAACERWILDTGREDELIAEA
jgi:hypothetical protein